MILTKHYLMTLQKMWQDSGVLDDKKARVAENINFLLVAIMDHPNNNS